METEDAQSKLPRSYSHHFETNARPRVTDQSAGEVYFSLVTIVAQQDWGGGRQGDAKLCHRGGPQGRHGHTGGHDILVL